MKPWMHTAGRLAALAWAMANLTSAGALRLPVAQVELGVDKRVKVFPGRVVPVAQVNVIPQVSGEILEVGFENGAVVKKGDLLYPLLKTRYEIAGPSDLMWTEDDEIRDELAALCRAERGEDWAARLDAVLKRAQEMVFKENNIFFPICAVNLSEEEWRGIYRDEADYGSCLGIARYPWEGAGETAAAETLPETAGEIVMPGGHLTRKQLIALLNTIPMEITFVDAQDINRFFNEGPKVFKRPGMALDREVFSCHPPKIEPMVRAILEDFRAGKRDRVPVWTEKGGRTMLVTYLAVRDREGTYLGTVELVQDMEFAREHFAR